MNKAIHPAQFPSYGFFGYAAQLHSADLDQGAINIISKNLSKIGKGAYPSGILTITRCPVWQGLHAGGNDAMQRTCRYSGAARAKEGYAAMHSKLSAVQYIRVTFTVNPIDMSWVYVDWLDDELAYPPEDLSTASKA